MNLGIEGKVALVAGASQGIGHGIAAELAAAGATVAIASRSRERIDAAAATIGATGFVFDSHDLDGAPALIDEVAERLGPVDILVTNSGGPPAGPDPLGFARAQWESAYRELVLAPMALIEHAAPGMRERRWGRILNVGSVSSREPVAGLILSNAHRISALAAFKTLANDLAGDGVTINTVLTGHIATDRIAALYGARSSRHRRTPRRRSRPAGWERSRRSARRRPSCAPPAPASSPASACWSTAA